MEITSDAISQTLGLALDGKKPSGDGDDAVSEVLAANKPVSDEDIIADVVGDGEEEVVENEEEEVLDEEVAEEEPAAPPRKKAKVALQTGDEAAPGLTKADLLDALREIVGAIAPKPAEVPAAAASGEEILPDFIKPDDLDGVLTDASKLNALLQNVTKTAYERAVATLRREQEEDTVNRSRAVKAAQAFRAKNPGFFSNPKTLELYNEFVIKVEQERPELLLQPDKILYEAKARFLSAAEAFKQVHTGAGVTGGQGGRASSTPTPTGARHSRTTGQKQLQVSADIAAINAALGTHLGETKR